MTRPELVKLMEKCQADTRETLGPGATGRLANWQKHESDLDGLLQFIKARLRTEARENGHKLELANKLSLERIVVYHCPELFEDQDITWAKATLQGL